MFTPWSFGAQESHRTPREALPAPPPPRVYATFFEAKSMEERADLAERQAQQKALPGGSGALGLWGSGALGLWAEMG